MPMVLFIYLSDKKTIKTNKGALTVMKGKRTTRNIFKLLGSTVVGRAHWGVNKVSLYSWDIWILIMLVIDIDNRRSTTRYVFCD